jgi:shikimate kinase
MVENSDVMIAIGGGEVARDELTAAKRSGKRVEFIPADMNHQVAREKAQKKGQPPPTDFRGAAATAF